MKKTMLLSAAIAASCSAFAAAPGLVKADASALAKGPKAPVSDHIAMAQTRAEGDMESIDFSYAEGFESAYSLNNLTGGVSRVYMGFEMNADDIKAFAGGKVTGITVISPTGQNNANNTIPEARFFISTDLTKEDYSQMFNLTKSAWADNYVTLDEPYTITGDEEALFFGYSLVIPKANNMYYLITDGVPNQPSTGIYGVSDTDAFPEDFYVFGNDIGALSMWITIERESLPKYAAFASFPSTICLPLGEAMELPVTLKATSGAPIESVTIEYTLGGQLNDNTYEFSTPVAAGASRYIGVNLLFPAQSEKLNEEVEFRITKLNGIENTGEGAVATANVVVVSEVPVHQTLYEEYTGTWCPWCPRGFAALEYMRNNYPEFVTASIHYDDPMQVMNQFPSPVQSFPSAVLSRGTIVDPYYGTQSFDMEVPVVGDILDLNAIPTPWKIAVSHLWESENSLIAKAEVANMAGFKNGNYRLAYLLVADGISGVGSSWYQKNNYASYKPEFVEELNAFCKGGEYGKSTVIGLVFNDVVISPEGVYGVDGSIPSALEAEQPAEHLFTFDLSKIDPQLIPDRNKLRVIAMVLDADGAVLNCAKDEVNDYDPSAVDGVIVGNEPAVYFDLNGRRIAHPTEGVFIRRQGTRTEKVLVK